MSPFTRWFLLPLMLWSCTNTLVLGDFSHDLKHLEQRWAEVNYQLKGKTRLAAFSQLVGDAQFAVQESQNSAEALIWSGIIKSTYASAKGKFWGLELAKRARIDLEAAMLIDANAMNGVAYAYLGELYARVPIWPLAFGDDSKAEALLKQALQIDPDSIDNNYLYGSFLIDEKRYDDARHYLLKAQSAPIRPGRILTDSGRQDEILRALAAIPER